MPRNTDRNLAQVAATGDRLKTLETLRDRLAGAIDTCNDASELAALALRLTVTLREINELGGKADEGEGDDLAAKRRAKLSAAAGS